MFIKVPVYVDYRGSVHDPELLRDVVTLFVEKLFLSERSERKLTIPASKKRLLREQDIDPDKIILVSRKLVLDGLR